MSRKRRRPRPPANVATHATNGDGKPSTNGHAARPEKSSSSEEVSNGHAEPPRDGDGAVANAAGQWRLPPPKAPTDVPPGPGRVAVYRERLEQRCSLWHAGDTYADAPAQPWTPPTVHVADP
jgi:hypothetical protein